MTLLLLIGFSTVALAAIIHIIGVVMTFKVWVVKSFIATTLRIGYCTACLVKILTAMSAGFLAKMLFATPSPTCPATSSGLRAVLVPDAYASLAAYSLAGIGTAAASACASTRV